MADFEGSLSWIQITEGFTIPQIELMLKDKPRPDYDKEEGEDIPKVSDAQGVMDFLMKRK